MAKVFVGAGLVALVVAGGVSVVSGKTMFVLGVWSVTGPLFGVIAGYYFKADRRDTV